MSEEQERQVLLGLAVSSLPNEDEVRAAVFGAEERAEPPRLAESLELASSFTLEGGRRSHRVLMLDLLAKVAHRRGFAALEAEQGSLLRYVDAAVTEAESMAREGSERPARVRKRAKAKPSDAPQPVEDDPQPRVVEPLPHDEAVRVVVEALRAVPERPDQHHWTTFAQSARHALRLTDAEIDRPLCTDDTWVTMPSGEDAVRTAVWFWSDRPAKEFARWTDPRVWDQDCHLFFKSVEAKGGAAPKTVTFTDVVFTETIEINASSYLTTDLAFTRTVKANSLYALDFDLPGAPAPNAPIIVDCGQVTVRSDPHAPPERRTALLAEKYIRFQDPAFLTWPTVACDTFWTEFAVTMALGCGAD